METFSALLAIWAGNSPVPSEFPAQRPVMQSFDVFFDLCLNRRLCKQSWGWWLEMPSHSLLCQCNEICSCYALHVFIVWYKKWSPCTSVFDQFISCHWCAENFITNMHFWIMILKAHDKSIISEFHDKSYIFTNCIISQKNYTFYEIRHFLTFVTLFRMKTIALDHKIIINIRPRVFDENWANIITADAFVLDHQEIKIHNRFCICS